MNNKKLDINDVLGEEITSPITSFAEADKEVQQSKNNQKGGRPTEGKSKAVHDVRFKIDDETFNALMEMSDYKTRTVHAVAKKILMAHMSVKD